MGAGRGLLGRGEGLRKAELRAGEPEGEAAVCVCVCCTCV